MRISEFQKYLPEAKLTQNLKNRIIKTIEEAIDMYTSISLSMPTYWRCICSIAYNYIYNLNKCKNCPCIETIEGCNGPGPNYEIIRSLHNCTEFHSGEKHIQLKITPIFRSKVNVELKEAILENILTKKEIKGLDAEMIMELSRQKAEAWEEWLEIFEDLEVSK